MKFKYYLRGLGIGIIISTIILMIAYSGNKTEITDEEVIKRAEALGMVMREESLFPHFKENKDSEQSDKTEMDMNTEVTTESASEIETEKMTETASEIAEDSKMETEQNISEDTRQKYRLIIPEGCTAQGFSTELEVNGVIESASSLIEYLRGEDYITKLRVGEYDIPYGATNEEIYHILQNERIVKKQAENP